MKLILLANNLTSSWMEVLTKSYKQRNKAFVSENNFRAETYN